MTLPRDTARLPFPGPGIEAVVFDLDGVVTDTAHVHEAAWKSVFDDFLRTRAQQTGTSFAEFTAEEYGHYVDGKPRYEGAASFLTSRGIDLPAGDPSDPPGDTSVAALANRKNERFLTVLAEQGVEPYPASVRVIGELRAYGVQVGLITSSRNGRAVLKAAGLTSLFNVIIDGVDASEAGLAGKPSPDVFVAATLQLGTVPERAAIVEDSQAGCVAGRQGGFGFVLGVDRLGMPEALLEAGAHAVVSDLDALEVTTQAETAAIAEAPPESPDRPALTLVPSAEQQRPLSTLPSALAARGTIAARLRSQGAVVFLDFDGTLSPIVDHPADARMSEAVHAAVEQLAAAVPVAIVSGRDLRDVRDRAAVDGAFVAGSHGFEIVAPDGTPLAAEGMQDFSAYLPALDAAEEALRRMLARLEGVAIERKRFAVAVHYRMADPSTVPAIETAVESVRDDAVTLRVTGGKKVFELRPDVDWDKGAALEFLLGLPGLGGDSPMPLYIGDDLTDEDAYRAVLAHDGIAIAVLGEEERLTLAEFSLADPEQVGGFLSYLAMVLQGAERP